jgi:hypothetical protein
MTLGGMGLGRLSSQNTNCTYCTYCTLCVGAGWILAFQILKVLSGLQVIAVDRPYFKGEKTWDFGLWFFHGLTSNAIKIKAKQNVTSTMGRFAILKQDKLISFRISSKRSKLILKKPRMSQYWREANWVIGKTEKFEAKQTELAHSVAILKQNK